MRRPDEKAGPTGAIQRDNNAEIGKIHFLRHERASHEVVSQARNEWE